MCWILWIYSNKPVVQDIYDWLTVLQHRGQDAAWIATFDWNKKYKIKWKWLVRDVFRTRDIRTLIWNIWIWHVRYPTAWCHDDISEAQPFYVNSPYWIVLAHNWNLINAEKLAREIFEQDFRHLSTDSDSEILLNVLAHELAENGKKNLKPEDIFNSVERLYDRCKWAYSAISYIFGHWMLAFRDPFAIRPLCIWRKKIENELKTENWKLKTENYNYIIASESVAISSLWYEFARDVLPWEAIYIDQKWVFHSKVCHKNPVLSPCIFEYIYLARPDSVIDGISVYKARLRLWENLWKKILINWAHLKIDVVIPIPDTSRTTAVQLAHVMNLPYREWFIKNRYIWRTFIMPGQEVRQKSIRQKLNPIELEIKWKNVLLIDDSIVRWNTMKEIVKMTRAIWAKKVYVASAAPKIKFPNVYWIDMPSRKELIANWRDTTQIAKEIWADFLFYQDLETLWKIVAWEIDVKNFDKSCFDWVYCTGGVGERYLEKVERDRG